MLKDKQKRQIDRMTKGDALLRIGNIWYGEDDRSTVTNIYYFGNKRIQTLLPIRAESAISFSQSMPPMDTLNVELVVNYAAFRTHIQSLTAQAQISPVLPVMNPVIAAMTQPVQLNKRVYLAYGFTDVNKEEILQSTNERRLMEMYSSVPVQMRIDSMSIETMPGTPRDIRIILTLTRALTSNIYGDRVQYVTSMEDAIGQHSYIKKVLSEGGDNLQGDAIAAMMGTDVEGMRGMIDAMRNPEVITQEVGAVLTGSIKELLGPDLYRVELSNGSYVTVMPYGVEALNSLDKLKAFGLESLQASAGLGGEIGASIRMCNTWLRTTMGMELTGIMRSTMGTMINSNVQMTVIERGPITRLDGDRATDVGTGNLIYYCLINHLTLSDIGNTLIAMGHGFHSPRYVESKVPAEYRTARTNARNAIRRTIRERVAALRDDSGPDLEAEGVSTNSNPERTAAMLYQLNKAKYPWEQRRELRRELGRSRR